jgi:DNA primase catalytic core
LTRQPDLDRLKQAIKIDELARELGLEIKGKQARCFNNASHKNGDKHFSLGFDLETNRFKCFACGVSGSVIDLYKEIKGVETGEAIRALSGLAGLDAFKAVKKPAGEITPAVSIKGLYEALRSFCGELDAESLNYLTGKTRGLKPETIARFKMFSIKDYSKANQYLKDSFSREQLQQAGIISDEGNLIFYKHKLLIPFYQGGDIVFLQGRRLDSDQPRYLMLKGRACPLFNTDTLKGLMQGDRVYICEGVFDAVILEQAGFKAVAILGVNNFKREMLSLFSGLDVVLCLDSDEAGQRATEALSGLFLLNGQVVKRKVLPEGIKDITEYFIK